jgi:hypothetical protein
MTADQRLKAIRLLADAIERLAHHSYDDDELWLVLGHLQGALKVLGVDKLDTAENTIEVARRAIEEA